MMLRFSSTSLLRFLYTGIVREKYCFSLNANIHFAAAKKHIGLYSGPEAVEQFADKLEEAGCKYSKGSIQIPYSDELPLDLISAIAAWCRDTGNHA